MKLFSTKKYFFGYLFVRLAKAIAVVVILLGVVLVLFRYAQADNAAGSIAYRASTSLDQRLDRLATSFGRAGRLVAAFSSAPEAAKFNTPQFARSIHSDRGFDALQEQLANVDRDRSRMKLLVTERLDSSLGKIEQRLRSYASSLRALASPSPAATSPASPAPTVAQTPTSSREEQETLFSKQVDKREADARFSTLDSARRFFSNLEAQAESLESRKNLFDSVTEIEALKKLLPIRIETLAEPEVRPTPPSSDVATQAEERSPAKAEQVANRLSEHRRAVRDAILSSWALDDAFDEASELTGAEANKCRSASLIVNGIWLNAFGQMAMLVIAAVFVAFLILVMADLTQTLLDTATNTGIIAEASRLPRK